MLFLMRKRAEENCDLIGYLMDLCGFGRDLWHWMGSGVGCGYGQEGEGVESGVGGVVDGGIGGLEDWRRKSPKKIVDQRESEIEW